MQRRLFPLLALAGLLCACAARVPPPPKPVVRSIVVVPAAEPEDYVLQNVTALPLLIPIASALNHVDSTQKAKALNARMAPRTPIAATAFTDAVVGSLRASGYQVEVLRDPPRFPDDPDTIDFAKLRTTADAVLQLRLSAVGLYSPTSSYDYLPRVNAWATVVTPDGEQTLYDAQVYYGVDGRRGTDWSITADPRFAYPSFDAVLANLDSVRAAFQTGGREVGLRVAEQVHRALKTP